MCKRLKIKILSLSVMFTLIGYNCAFNSIKVNAKIMTHGTTSKNIKNGVILHAFDWSFNNIKKELPNISAAGYTSVQVSPVQGTKNSSINSSDWWLLYQPTNQSIGNSQLGSYKDFKDLCSEAKNYGISIIVDAVMNHMANNGNKDELAPEVDSSFKDPSFYHHNGQCNDWNNREDITQKGVGMPDLNTQNPAVQGKAINFLNQCIDAGASGFRFDSAKHIETDLGLDANTPWASNYWENVLGSLHNKSDLYIYGEVLQDGKVDNISAYESLMNVEASSYDASLRKAVKLGDFTDAKGMGGLDNNKCVDFVETHDEYENGTSKDLTDWQRKAGWAIAASRSGSVPLFFDRPTGSIGSEGDNLWNDSDVIAINDFHNAMAGQNENLTLENNNKAMLIERGDNGTVIVNDGDSFNLNSPTNLNDGQYNNHGSKAASLVASGGILTGTVPANSIIILYNNGSVTNYIPHADYKIDYDSSNLVKGHTFTIYYNGNLTNSSNVSLHLGINGWNNTQNLSMIKDSNGFWETSITIPNSANTLNFCFTNGTNWDNNSNNNWTLNVCNNIPNVQVSPAPQSSKEISIYYNGTLASSSSNITLHWGYNGFIAPQDVTMTKQNDGRWLAKITLPSGCYAVNMVFKNQSGTWDNNNSNNYNFSSTKN
ncbi:hypothetical protein CLROS_000280 [Clostridium felsineum]|uniref:Alpha-amylase n=2 Tax=Clostridium felsineum TaxID=36839 RepID=A0A1S8L6T8_9CLOT|nr:hypothetical protein CLROS_000280 [Clostridium felsineum]URZ09692.1 hypothetical protein CROST_003850 [Clostridium felsineum]